MRLLLALPGALLAGACAKAPPRLPEPYPVEEIAVPWEHSFPGDVAVDESGRVWFTDRFANVIGRYDPERRTFDRFEPPTPKSAPYGLVRTRDGVLWFAESQGGRIGRLDPATGAITEYVLPGVENGGPHLLAASAGRIWFTAREARKWGWLDLATGAVHVRDVPQPTAGQLRTSRTYGGSRPYAIAAGPDGVWFGLYEGSALYHVRTGIDTLEEHRLVRPVPVDSALVRRLRGLPDTASARRQIESLGIDAIVARRSASDAQGRIYVGDFVRGRIARFDPRAHELEIFPFLDRTRATYGIGIDSWGRIWSYQMYSHQVVMIDPRSGERATAQLRSDGTVRHIGFDPKRKRVWLPISDSGRLGLIQLR